MADIRIKISTDTSELKKDVKQSSKLLDRMEKSHEKSIKSRTKLEAKNYEKINKLRKEDLKDSIKANKLLERENEKRLKKEVQAEKDASREKEQARARFQSFALQAAGQGLGSLGLGTLGAGVGLIGAGGLLGAGAGIGIAALSGLSKFISQIFDFRKELIRFGIRTRLTRGEVMALEDSIDEAATRIGSSSPKIFEAVEAFSQVTGRAIQPEKVDDLAVAFRVSGQSAQEFASTLEVLRSRGLRTNEDLLETYTLLAARGGDVTKMTEALQGAFSDLDLTNRSNVRSFRELGFVLNVSDWDEFSKVLKEIRKESGGAKGPLGRLLEVYQRGARGKAGKDLRLTSELVKDLITLQRSGKLPEELMNIDFESQISIKPVEDELRETADRLADDATVALDRLQQLLFIFTKETVFAGLEKALQKLGDWLADPDNIDAFLNSLEQLKNAIISIAGFFGYVDEQSRVRQENLRQEAGVTAGAAPTFGPNTARLGELEQRGAPGVQYMEALLPGITNAIENANKPIVNITGADTVEMGEVNRGGNLIGTMEPVFGDN